MSNLARLAVLAAALAAAPALAAEGHAHGAAPAAGQGQPAAQERCQHGVARKLCTRCNPRLAAVFKAKGDWCGEHERPESQCVLCHPELAKKGIQ